MRGIAAPSSSFSDRIESSPVGFPAPRFPFLRPHLPSRNPGADSLNIYVRRKGESPFRLLAGKRVRFPMDDDTPPATAGQPEEREYQAIAVIGDEEVGVPSDIVSAVFRP